MWARFCLFMFGVELFFDDVPTHPWWVRYLLNVLGFALAYVALSRFVSPPTDR